jgi:hypothetical protein
MTEEYKKGFGDGVAYMFGITCKVENPGSDEGKTDKGMFIPEAEDAHEMDELRLEIQRLKDKEKAQDKRMWYIETKIRELEMRI